MTNELYHYGVKGMRWGVRRYQNDDGTLTDLGKRRYDRDVRENNSKKKDNRINIDGPDPKRWAKEDVSRTKKVVDSSANIVKDMQKIEKDSRPTHKKQKMDLSNMTDQELRDRINRANLEKQYNDMFAPDDVSVDKGRQFVEDVLDAAGTVLAISSSALTIALAIKELTG